MGRVDPPLVGSGRAGSGQNFVLITAGRVENFRNLFLSVCLKNLCAYSDPNFSVLIYVKFTNFGSYVICKGRAFLSAFGGILQTFTEDVFIFSLLVYNRIRAFWTMRSTNLLTYLLTYPSLCIQNTAKIVVCIFRLL